MIQHGNGEHLNGQAFVKGGCSFAIFARSGGDF
jgi:hypothetical protein